MTWSKLAAAGVIFLSAALIGGAGGDTAKKIVGTWEVTKSEDAPPDASAEFTQDGKIILRAKINGETQSIDGTYKVDGNKIITTITFKGQTKTETNTVKELTDKSMVVVDERGKTEEYKRVK